MNELVIEDVTDAKTGLKYCEVRDLNNGAIVFRSVKLTDAGKAHRLGVKYIENQIRAIIAGLQAGRHAHNCIRMPETSSVYTNPTRGEC